MKKSDKMSTKFMIGGRKFSQIFLEHDVPLELEKTRKGHTREEISPVGRYLFWFVTLTALTFMDNEYRLPYLWSGTIVLWLYSFFTGNMTFHLTLIAVGGLGHSLVHNIWPFLNDSPEGFDGSVSVFPDVFFHMTMLVFVWVTQRAFLSPTVDRATIFCIIGAIFNCCLTNYKEGLGLHYVLFNLTSVFQAVSTAFWVAAVLHYGEWDKKSYGKWLFSCNIYFIINWALYNMDHFDVWPSLKLMQLSMRFRYIEGLFIVCTWVPLIFFKAHVN